MLTIDRNSAADAFVASTEEVLSALLKRAAVSVSVSKDTVSDRFSSEPENRPTATAKVWSSAVVAPAASTSAVSVPVVRPSSVTASSFDIAAAVMVMVSFPIPLIPLAAS